MVFAISKASDQPAHKRSLIRAFASPLNIFSMSVKLVTEHHLEFLSLKGGCTGLSESTLVKMPHCWKSHVAAHFVENVGSISQSQGGTLIFSYIRRLGSFFGV